MSWQSLSATNDTHRNSKLSAKKVIVKNIVVSQETTMGSMDVSNLEYTRDDYSGNILTIEETLRGPDISLNRIKVLNQSDTSGVVKFVRPFVAPAAGLEGLRAYDGSFTTTKVLHDFQVGSVTKRTGDPIEILNDASFSNHISAPDVCANVIGSRNGPPIYLSGDVSINEGLQCSDISVSHIHPLGAATKLFVNTDISASGAIYASDLSGFTFRAVDVSANDVYGANSRIDVVADISVNGDIRVTEISMNTLGGHNNRITIHNDLSVNGDLIVGEDLSLSHLFTTSDYIHFHKVTDISNVIKNVDISVGEIHPKELGIVRVVNNVGIQKETLIINGDVSFSGRVEADWVDSEFNVLARVDTLATLISNTAKYPIGSLLQVKNNNSKQIDIFIKTNKESWYKLKSTNATPLFTNFTLSYEGFTLLAGDFSGDINNTNTDKANYFYYPPQSDVPDVSVGLQNYEEVGGFGDYDEVVFYVKKIKEEVNSVYLFDISASDQESDDILFSLIGDKTISDFSYLNGAGWGLSLPDNVEDETDISRIHIKVPINNGFDVSFIVRADDKISTYNDKIITIKKINEVPVWKHMVLEASNSELISSTLSSYDEESIQFVSDSSFNTEEWYSIHDQNYLNYFINPDILPIDHSDNDDVSHTFNVRYFKPEHFNSDVSYYTIDLSSLDPEGFDVSYIIKDVYDTNYYNTTDWSYHCLNNMVYVKVPGEGYSGIDFSFEIMSHDNSIEDVSNLIYNSYYSDFHKNIIVVFRKDINIPDTFEIIRVSNEGGYSDYADNLFLNPSIEFNFVDNSYQLYLNLRNDNRIQSITVLSESKATAAYAHNTNYNNTYLNIDDGIMDNFTKVTEDEWYIKINEPTYEKLFYFNNASLLENTFTNDSAESNVARLQNTIEIILNIDILFDTTEGVFNYVDLKSDPHNIITLTKNNKLDLKVINLDEDDDGNSMTTSDKLANSSFSGTKYSNSQWIVTNNTDGVSVRELSRYDEVDSITYMTLGNIQYSLKNDNNEISHVYIHINLNNQGGGSGGDSRGCGTDVNKAGVPGGIAAFSAVNVKCYINSSDSEYNIKIVNGVSEGGGRGDPQQNKDPQESYIQWFLYDASGQLYEYKITVIGGTYNDGAYDDGNYGKITIERRTPDETTWGVIFNHNRGSTSVENTAAINAMFDDDDISDIYKFCYFGSKYQYTDAIRRLGSDTFNSAKSGGWTHRKIRSANTDSTGGNTNMHSFHYYPEVEPGLTNYYLNSLPSTATNQCNIKSNVGIVFNDTLVFNNFTSGKHLGTWFDYVTKPSAQPDSITKDIFRYLQHNDGYRIYKPFPGKGGVGAHTQHCNDDGNGQGGGGWWGYPKYVNGWYWRSDWLSNALHGWQSLGGSHDGWYWNGNSVFYDDYSAGTRNSSFNYPAKGVGGAGSAMSYIRITEYKIKGAQFTVNGSGDWNN